MVINSSDDLSWSALVARKNPGVALSSVGGTGIYACLGKVRSTERQYIRMHQPWDGATRQRAAALGIINDRTAHGRNKDIATPDTKVLFGPIGRRWVFKFDLLGKPEAALGEADSYFSKNHYSKEKDSRGLKFTVENWALQKSP